MNWGELKTAVQQYLEAGTPLFVGNLPLYARLAEEDIYRQVQLPFARETSTTSIIPGDRFLTQPTNCQSVYSLAIYTGVNGEQSFLLPKDSGFLREAYPDPTTPGKPRYYAYHDELTFLIAPTPNITYNVELIYFMKPLSISQGDVATNTNWLSQNAENVLLFGLIMHGYIFEKGDQDVIQLYKGQFDQSLAALKMITEGRQKKDTYRTPDQRVPV
jgi:hypothetical protein